MGARHVIALDGVGKDYVSGAGVVRALRDVDLAFERGELVAIVGTSGSGKSTLMNILGCLDRPTRGTYRLDGLDVGTRSADARAIVRNELIGFVFQGFNLLPRTTALENVELPLVYRGVPARARRERAERALAQVGLADRGHHTPSQLSGGQQQRVAIARALVTDPPLLLADEPTGNLDTRTSLEVLALLQQLNRTAGITIVLVTHEPDIAACASRVVTVRDGRVLSDERNAAPVDAAAELAALPPPVAAASPDTELGAPRAAGRGGPVPATVHLAHAAATLGGGLLGAAYERWLLDRAPGLAPLAFALVVEAFVAARFARVRLGAPLTRDQRARLALHVTLGLVAVAGATLAAARPEPVVARVGALGLAGTVGALLGATLGLAALRYALLGVLGPGRGRGR